MNQSLVSEVRTAQSIADQESDILSAEALIKAFLPETKEQSELVAELEQLSANRLTINSISFDQTQDIPGETTQTQRSESIVGALEFPFTVSGSTDSFQDMIFYLQSLELNRRKFQLVGIDINPIGSEDDDVEAVNEGFDVTMRMRVFLQDSSLPAAPVESGDPELTEPAT